VKGQVDNVKLGPLDKCVVWRIFRINVKKEGMIGLYSV
jgi:hypothetical protein